jgi:hypothetical protein
MKMTEVYVTGMPLDKHNLTILTIEPYKPRIEIAEGNMSAARKALKNSTAFAKEIYGFKPDTTNHSYPRGLPSAMSRAATTLQRNVSSSASARREISDIADELYFTVQELERTSEGLVGWRKVDYQLATTRVTLIRRRLELQANTLLRQEQLAAAWQRRLAYFRFDNA